MKVKVGIECKDKTKNFDLEVEVKDTLRGLRLLNAVDKAVNKTLADNPDWTNWYLK